MGNPTATLERRISPAMNAPASQLDEVERPRAGAMKFTYPSGSRPLEGYTIKRGVGRGGFGEVYFATSDAGKEVALKLIRRNLEVELRGVTQCLNLKHSNLIGLYDIRTDEMGDQWVIMEYVSGESLEEVIDRNPNGMPIEQVLWWMRGVCHGVSYLHDHGIVHRDLKPGNIFSDEGVVKIGDYGLAKFISCSRRSGQTESVGTVHYMAPEIANGRYGREIDTYALGIILFEMLTGRVPFEGESVGEVLMKHLTAEPNLDALEEPYNDIVRRALAKDPDVRLKSVAELMSLLPGGDDIPHVRQAAQHSDADAAAEYSPGAAARQAFAEQAQRVRAFPSPLQPQLPLSEIEEPIWKAIREAGGKLRQKLHGDNVKQMSALQKSALVLGLVVASLFFFEGVIAIAFPVLICYAVYYVVWVALIRPSIRQQGGGPVGAGQQLATAASRPADERTIAWQPRQAEVAASPAMTKPQRRLRPNWRDRANQEIAAKPLSAKLSELTGSMILAAMFAAISACIAPLLLGDQGTSESLAVHLWLAVVGTLGSWAILVPAKFVEGKLEDQVPMRVTLLAMGALVGLAAWFLSDGLFLHLPSWGDPVDVRQGIVSQEMLGWNIPPQGINPPLAIYVTYFAFLFLVPRWWRQGESTRSDRLSVWWVLVCVFWAWLLHFFWWFPQPAGMMVAAVIAISTQLSSPWMPPSRRRALSGELENLA
jgi:hypothetical protein